MIIEAITKGFDQISSDLKGVGGGLDDVEKSVKNNSNRWTELSSKISVAQQAFSTVAGAAKQAYQFVGEGAQLELARSQFDNLAASIGTTSDALLNDLGRATGGMMSNADQIASASQIISLGLADTQEGTVRLAKSVSTLGLDMQQVILTFANNSKARLDALGLSVEDVTQKAAALEAQGFSGDAFDEAVLIALEAKMELLGDAAETTAGQMKVLEAAWRDSVDAAKMSASEMAGPTLSAYAGFISASDAIKKALDDEIISYGEAIEMKRQMSFTDKTAADIVDELTALYERNAKAVKGVSEATSEMHDVYAGLTPVLTGVDAALGNYIVRQEEFTDATESSIQASAELSDKFAQQNNMLGGTEAALARSRAELNQLQADAAASGDAFVGATSGVGGFTSAITGAVTEAGNLLTPLQEIQNMLDQTTAQETYAESTARINEKWQEAQNINIEEKLTGVYQGLQDTGTEAGNAASEVETYIGRLGEVPDEVQTQLTLRYKTVGGPGGYQGEAGDPTRYAGGSTGNQGRLPGSETYFPGPGSSGFREYAEGGIVPGPIGQPQLAIVHGGETVIPPGQTSNSLSVTQNFYGSSPDTMQSARDGLLDAAREIGLVGYN
jgi:hypothetical protein